ncbi:peptidase, M23B family, partial [mine drainage metagenome]
MSAVFLTVFLTFSVVAYSLLHKENQMVALARQSQHQKEAIVRIYSRLQEIHGRLLDLTKKEDRIRMIMDPDGKDPDAGQL